jgi:hypothetical protein
MPQRGACTLLAGCIAPGSTIHTDGWPSYQGLDQLGYDHEVTVLRGRRKDASTLLPRVHLVVVASLKRRLVGTHSGEKRTLGYYLDELTFRSNRQQSKKPSQTFLLSRLFRLVEQAVATDPTTLFLPGSPRLRQRRLVTHFTRARESKWIPGCDEMATGGGTHALAYACAWAQGILES